MLRMMAQLVFLFLVFLLKYKVTYASMCHTQGYSELDVYLQGFTFESFIVNTIFECYRKCEENMQCASINMNFKNKTCDLKYSDKTRYKRKALIRQNTVYMEVRDTFIIPSCKKLKEDDSQAKSGVYWMKFNESSSAPFQVFCDMTTDGGGWTLVYSYTFTEQSNSGSSSNAVSPMPNWPVDPAAGKWVPQSTTTPLSESSRSAMDFALWKKIGNEVLLKPNISNWVACVKGTGSLVNWEEGSVTCRVVKAITPTCTTVSPNILELKACGPCFLLNDDKGRYIYLDGLVDRCKPCHDPCGTFSQDNQLTSVPNPGGVLYVR